MDLDALLLSRLQFAFTIAFHILFPAFTIGLASYLAVLEALWLRTRREAFRTLYLFWVKVFAISFGMGVGLAIARRLAELQGGRLELDSAPGRGARFWLLVPAA